MIAKKTEEPLIDEGVERPIPYSVKFSKLTGIDDFILRLYEAPMQRFPWSRIFSNKIESLIAEAIELLI